MLISRFYTHGSHRTLQALSRLLLLFFFSSLLLALCAVFCSSSVKAFSDIEVSADPLNLWVLADDNRFGVFHCYVSGGYPPYSYKWYYKSPESDNFRASTLSTSTNPEYLVPASMSRDGYQFLCVVTDSIGNRSLSNIVNLHVSNFRISDSLVWLGENLFTPLFNFSLPWGITFGAVIVGVFGAPLLVKAYKKFF